MESWQDELRQIGAEYSGAQVGVLRDGAVSDRLFIISILQLATGGLVGLECRDGCLRCKKTDGDNKSKYPEQNQILDVFFRDEQQVILNGDDSGKVTAAKRSHDDMLKSEMEPKYLRTAGWPSLALLGGGLIATGLLAYFVDGIGGGSAFLVTLLYILSSIFTCLLALGRKAGWAHGFYAAFPAIFILGFVAFLLAYFGVWFSLASIIVFEALAYWLSRPRYTHVGQAARNRINRARQFFAKSSKSIRQTRQGESDLKSVNMALPYLLAMKNAKHVLAFTNKEVRDFEYQAPSNVLSWYGSDAIQEMDVFSWLQDVDETLLGLVRPSIYDRRGWAAFGVEMTR